MPESIVPAGTKPPSSTGTLVRHRPSAAWEYRLSRADNGTVEAAEIGCVNFSLCKGVIKCKTDAKGLNTIGAQICPECGKKAYVRIDGTWFEVS